MIFRRKPDLPPELHEHWWAFLDCAEVIEGGRRVLLGTLNLFVAIHSYANRISGAGLVSLPLHKHPVVIRCSRKLNRFPIIIFIRGRCNRSRFSRVRAHNKLVSLNARAALTIISSGWRVVRA